MRTELDVPFSHKDEAKALGAKWDRAKKIWYVPDGVNPEPFAAWLPGVDRSDPSAPYIYLVLGKRECWKCHEQTAVAAFGIPYRVAEDSGSEAAPGAAPAMDDAGHIAIDTARANAVAIVPALGCVPAEIRDYLRERCGYKPVTSRTTKTAIILSCLADLDYTVEWRVVNSAEYGFPQRRKRVYIFCEKNAGEVDLVDRMHNGVMAKAFPAIYPDEMTELDVLPDPYENSTRFGVGQKTSQFKNAGVMQGCHVLTCDFAEDYHGERRVLGDVLVDDANIPEQFYISDEKLPDWRYLKGSKREERTNKKTGFTYTYSEGAMSFPDATDKPSRTILTGEGGTGASRFKHVIECPDGRFRRLVPDELDQLQGFPKGWTDIGMTDGHRAFCMGNALVTGVPHRIGEAMVEVYGL